jgi:heme exporter protein D
MTWGGWEAFWAMGGHGPFVWGAYGVTALALIAEVFSVIRRDARARRDRALRQCDADLP